METHVKVLGVLFIVLSALGTLAALIVIAAFGMAGVATAAGSSGSDVAMALPFIGLAGTALAAFLLIVSLPGLLVGIGLLKYKPWARIAGIVLCVLNIVNFPFGTIVGVYGLYVLLSEDGARLFKPLPSAVA